MARTHAAIPNTQPTSRFHQDDGVLLGKGGVPIPTSPVRGISTLYPHGQPTVVHVDDGEIVPPAAVPPTVPIAPPDFVWVCDASTWQRNMDGWVAMQVLNAILGPLSLTLTDEQARKLPAECRWHFRRRPKPEPAWDDADVPETPEQRIARLEGEVADLKELVESMLDRATAPEGERPMTQGEKVAAGRARAAALREARGET